jgi:hypothetical protein
MSKTVACDVQTPDRASRRSNAAFQTHDRASLHNFHRINRANQTAGVAFDAEVGDDFVLFVRLEQNGVCWALLRTFGAANAQIVDLIFDHTLAFTRWTFAVDVRNVFFPEIF